MKYIATLVVTVVLFCAIALFVSVTSSSHEASANYAAEVVSAF